MTENPYQPPSPRPSSAGDGTAKLPWYETKPADWERTAAVCWIAAVAVLLFVGFIPLPPDVVNAMVGPRLIPGPSILGMVGYIGLTLLLATVPAACCTALHWAAMRASTHPIYRKILTLVAGVGGVLLTMVACAATHLLMIR